MYPGMAKTARDEGFDEVADWFETLAMNALMQTDLRKLLKICLDIFC